MMGWAFNSKKETKKEEEEVQKEEDQEQQDDDENDQDDGVQGINLEETELPRQPEKYSKEMYEELEQRVTAF